MSSKFITPRVGLDKTLLACFVVPYCPDMQAIVRGLLLALADVEQWEQIGGLTITPEQAVEMIEAVINSLSFQEL